MKFQTMILPNGKFALVVSEVQLDEAAAADRMTQFTSFRNSIGASACWVTNETVEVENALGNELLGNELLDGDDLLFQRIQEGAEFSPAGLVKTPAPHLVDVVSTAGWQTDGIAADEPGLEPGEAREPARLPGCPYVEQGDRVILFTEEDPARPTGEVGVVIDPKDQDGDIYVTVKGRGSRYTSRWELETPAEPADQPASRAVQPGDVVEVVTSTFEGGREHVGETGVVLDPPDNEGDLYIALEGTSPRTKLYISEWKLLPKEGDLSDPAKHGAVTFETLKPDYAADTQLVDLVAQGMHRDESIRRGWGTKWADVPSYAKNQWNRAAVNLLKQQHRFEQK